MSVVSRLVLSYMAIGECGVSFLPSFQGGMYHLSQQTEPNAVSLALAAFAFAFANTFAFCCCFFCSGGVFIGKSSAVYFYSYPTLWGGGEWGESFLFQRKIKICSGRLLLLPFSCALWIILFRLIRWRLVVGGWALCFPPSPRR